MTALPDRDFCADRDTARAKRKGSGVFPRLLTLGDQWVRQEADGSYVVINPIPDPQADGLVIVAA